MNVTTGARVLVVDDDRAHREMLRVVLTELGLPVDTAEDGVQALAQLAKSTPALMLLDMHMPNLDGLGTLRAMQDRGLRPVTVVLTAHADLSEVKHAVSGGLARGVIMKPWDRSVILRWVENTKRLASLKNSVTNMMTRLDRE